MCTVSFVGDDWSRRYPIQEPWVVPYTTPPYSPNVIIDVNPPTRQELDKLKAELEALKKLLKAAKLYDEETGQKDCEVEEKVALIKRLAELVDVDLEDLFDE
jgi:hypothetical protein